MTEETAIANVLREAAETGKDWLTWPKGETQAERFSAAQAVSPEGIRWQLNSDNTLGMFAKAKDSGRTLIEKESVPRKEIPQWIGEGPTALLDKQIAEGKTEGTLTGDDLKAGGEKLRKLYDGMYPDFGRRYVKRWGSTVQDVVIKTSKGDETVWGVRITPELRKAVVGEGQSRFMPWTPDPVVPGAESKGPYRIIPSKTNFRVYGPGGILLGVFNSQDKARALGEKKLSVAQEKDERKREVQMSGL